MKIITFVCAVLMMISCANVPTVEDLRKEDQFVWLEDRSNAKVDQWVEDHSSKTSKQLGSSKSFQGVYRSILKLDQGNQKLPNIEIIGRHAYTVYKPNSKSRGVWKRTSLKKINSHVSVWETVLSFDRLNELEKKKFTYSSISCLKPHEYHCLLSLATSGGDTVEVREFNLRTKKFVKNGFFWSAGKTSVEWIDINTVLASANFGKGTLLKSGFGKEVRIVKRGENSLSSPILTVPDDYLGIFINDFRTESNYPGLFASRYYSMNKFDSWYIYKGKAYEVPVPDGSWVSGVIGGMLIASIKSDWGLGSAKYKAGDVIGISLSSLVKNRSKEKVESMLVFRPQSNQFLNFTVMTTKNTIGIELIENVRSDVHFIKFENGKFKRVSRVSGIRLNRRLQSASYDSDKFLLKVEDFLVPANLTLYDSKKDQKKVLFTEKKVFDSSGMLVKQYWSESRDGTRIPYYIVGKKNSLSSSRSSLILRGYGAYGISYLPSYDRILGKNWLEQGGLIAYANIRGGGEFGPKWYKAALKESRYKSSEDYISVAEDLVRRGIVRKRKIAAYGGSAGGVMVGTAMIMRPDLFSAVCLMVPMIDVLAGDKLSNGGNWRGEFGDPKNPRERKAILKYSPYYNLKNGVKYPSVFAYSMKTDERVHPGHARKMVAKLESLGAKNVYYFEGGEGGHRAATTGEQRAYWKSLVLEYFKQELDLGDQ